MPQDSPLFEQLSRLLNDATAAAEGLHQDLDGFVKARLERILSEMDLVPREDFEAVKALAVDAAMQIERLKTRLAALENRPTTPRPVQKSVKKKYF